jgi:hypothetical protein
MTDLYEQTTTIVRRVPAPPPAPDLTDPVTGRTVVPDIVEIRLTHIEGEAVTGGAWAAVAVTGPRRLRSGLPGRDITSVGWHQQAKDGAPRPGWLTDLLTAEAATLPPWAPLRLGLATELTSVSLLQRPGGVHEVRWREDGRLRSRRVATTQDADALYRLLTSGDAR